MSKPCDIRVINSAFVPLRVDRVRSDLAKSRKSPLVREDTTTRRLCLWCGQPFASTGPGNRKCPKCTQYVVKGEKKIGPEKRIYSGADVEAD